MVGAGAPDCDSFTGVLMAKGHTKVTLSRMVWGAGFTPMLIAEGHESHGVAHILPLAVGLVVGLEKERDRAAMRVGL